MDLRSEKFGNRECRGKEREGAGERIGRGEEERVRQPARRECHHARVDKKGTRLELGEHHRT